MRRLLLIACLVALLTPYSLLRAITTEQEQQFTYYWYAAKQAIEEERYSDAFVLLEFCRMLNPNDGQTLTFLAILYNGIGQKERAMQTLKEAFEAAPGDQWYKYSHALLEQRTPDATQEAVKALEKAYRAQQPEVKEELLEYLQHAYMTTGQWAKAIKMQDELDRLKGFDAYSAVNRFRAYASWGKSKKAMEAVDKYLELDPTNVQFLLFKMEILERTGVRTDKLYAVYERILELDPANLTVLNNYAYHLAIHQGDLQKAERMSALTIREEPSNAVYLDTYGWILHLQGQNELALFYLNRALSNASNEHVKAEIEAHLSKVRNGK